jgi:hypothetical protein
MAESICSIDGCGRKIIARGWCNAHWLRWNRHGDPLAGRPPIGTKIGEPKQFIESAISYESNDCLIWPYCRVRGYAVIGKRLVSHIVCELTKGPRPTPKHEAAHSCGNGHLGCITPSHLRWATHAENCADKIAHGTNNDGERHSMAKLTEKDVAEIRILSGAIKQRDLASIFGVSQAQIWRIIHHRSWR